MDRKNIAMLFITIVVFFLLFHILPFLSYQRNKQAYDLYKDWKNNEAITVWKKDNDLYNAGTLTAREAIHDENNTTGLNQALVLLTQALLTDSKNKKIEHNKAIVEQLLQDNTQQKQGSGDQQQQWTEQWSWTQEEQSWSKNNNEQSDAAKAKEQWEEQWWQQSSLTQEEQQALDAYQQSLEQQQAQNQQFFWKEQQAQNPNDPFGMLEQFFGVNPGQLGQELPDQAEKDW